MSAYAGFCSETMRPIHVGDRVLAKDEWGYWHRDHERATGEIMRADGWLTTLRRADGSLFVADGHTTRLAHAPDNDEADRAQRIYRRWFYRINRRAGWSREQARARIEGGW